MKTLIIYDSFFGNTQKIAEKMAEPLGGSAVAKRVMNVTVADVEESDCILFGSPTRGFAPTAEMRKFMKTLPGKILSDKTIGVFDTRIDVVRVNVKVFSFLVRIFGYAADTLEKMAKRLGAGKVNSGFFFVTESEGPLADGELSRAARWAASVA